MLHVHCIATICSWDKVCLCLCPCPCLCPCLYLCPYLCLYLCLCLCFCFCLCLCLCLYLCLCLCLCCCLCLCVCVCSSWVDLDVSRSLLYVTFFAMSRSLLYVTFFAVYLPGARCARVAPPCEMTHSYVTWHLFRFVCSWNTSFHMGIRHIT